MNGSKIAIALGVFLSVAGCTTVGNPGPNARVPECSPDKQLVCEGVTGRRTGSGKDPHAVCGCAERVDHL